MKTNIWKLATIFLAVLCLTFFGAALSSAKGPGGGGGGGGEIPDYGDLIILYRDANGVPYPSAETLVEDPETGEMVAGGLCWQPIAFNQGTEACPAACVVDTGAAEVVDVDQRTCGIAAGCSGCTQEADFGRMNDARAPDSVFESQLADARVNLATADCTTLDPAGRMVASRVGDDDSVASKTIDSPLQNLAIYRELMLTGDIGTSLPQGADLLDAAARGLGAASDKTGELNVDMVAYLNQIMGLTLNNEGTLPTICETYREEVQGVIQLVEKCFLNYGAYGYERTTNFGALPSPAYIPGPPDSPVAGTFEYMNDDGSGTFTIVEGVISDVVFGDDGGDAGGNIGGFAQSADDTRAVIDFMHTHLVPDDYATPLVCEVAPGVVAYDVLISEESGLQVPKRMVDGSEGREFIVTVANASGSADPAEGTVTVTAIAESTKVDEVQSVSNNAVAGMFTLSFGSEVTGELAFDATAEDVEAALEALPAITDVDVTVGELDEWVIVFVDQDVPLPVADDTLLFGVASTDISTLAEGFTGDIQNSPWTFAFTDLSVGASESFTEFFNIDIGQTDTIDWTAVAAADFDVNPANNTVTATTGVKVTGGGGGGKPSR